MAEKSVFNREKDIRRIHRSHNRKYKDVYDDLSYLPEKDMLEKSLDAFLNKLQSPDISRLNKLKENWSSIVGAQIANVSEVKSCNKGIFSIEVSHNIWLRELSGPMKKVLINKINKFYNNQYCYDIRFVPFGGG